MSGLPDIKDPRFIGAIDLMATDCAAAFDPMSAVFRLAELLVDGGTCAHCHRIAGVDFDPIGASPMDTLVCYSRWDPELATFRRNCEGQT